MAQITSHPAIPFFAFLLVTVTVGMFESRTVHAADVTQQSSRKQNLIEYIAARDDLSSQQRKAWNRAVRLNFGGKALKDGSDEGVTAAKSVIAAAIFFDVKPEQGARSAYQAYYDTYRWVPPPIAINYQVLSFQGHSPAASARQMAFDFPRYFDADIAPELVEWWQAALKRDDLPKHDRRSIEVALAATTKLMSTQPASEFKVWRGEPDKEIVPRTDKPESGGTPKVPPNPSSTVLPRWQGKLGVALDESVARWIGVKYRWGGTSRRGIDCSGFSRAVFREALAADLPRNSRAQYRTGFGVKQMSLLPGDLVFFDTLDRGHVTHVGIYLGKGTFAHASSSKGVTRAQLSKRYYQRAYVGARRHFKRL